MKEVINWFLFLNKIKYTADRIENKITVLPSLLNFFSMFQMRFWYDKEPDDKNDVKIIAIRYINCGKETGLYTYNMKTIYKDTVTVFVLNEFLHYVVMSCIIKTHEKSKYDMDKNNTDIYKTLHETVSEEFIRN